MSTDTHEVVHLLVVLGRDPRRDQGRNALALPRPKQPTHVYRATALATRVALGSEWREPPIQLALP
jgi:hypothetical protein